MGIELNARDSITDSGGAPARRGVTDNEDESSNSGADGSETAGLGGDEGAGGVATSGGAGGVATSGGAGGVATSGGAGGEACQDDGALCTNLADAMIHRFSFEGVGAAIQDALANRPAVARGTTLNGSGQIELSGFDQYVDLPDNLISDLSDVSFEIWFLWRGGEPWQRLFEFGNVDSLDVPVNYLYATPKAGGSEPNLNGLAAGMRHIEGGDRQLRAGTSTEVNQLTHVVFIANGSSDRLTFYKNGQWIADRDTPVNLEDTPDEVNRLGRSLFAEDPDFNGAILEFRIYDQELSPLMVEKSFELGPDGSFPNVD